MWDDRSRRTRCRRRAAVKGVSSKRWRPAARRHGVKTRRLGTAAGADLSTEDTQAGQHVLGLAGGGSGVCGMGRQHLGAAGLALWQAEEMLIGLELEF